MHVKMVDNFTLKHSLKQLLLAEPMLLVSFITSIKFSKVEKVFISTLLDLSSPLTCMMVSNIWCFLIRYRTSQLCLAHLTLSRTSSPPRPLINILMDRLTDPLPQPFRLFELAKPNRIQARPETTLSSERLPADRPGGSVEDIIPDVNIWGFFSREHFYPKSKI